MYEQEKKRAIHLMILIYNTLFMTALIIGSVFLGWETAGAVLLFLGLVASWLMHITGKMPASIRLWLYVILTMLTFFFYGIHEAGIYELAPVMAVIILMYTVTEIQSFVRICAVTYYVTMCYNFIFILGNPLKLPVHTVARILLHFVLVFIAERLAESMIQRRRNEKKKMDEKIFQL